MTILFSLLLASNLCSLPEMGSDVADDWPLWRGQRDGIWRERGLTESLPERLEAVWRAPIGSGYSAPTVADGRVYVSDRVEEPEESERVHCFDAKTGKALWTYRYPCAYRGLSYSAGPRVAVQIHAGKAISLGAVGHLACLNAANGDVLWKRDLREEYDIEMPIWGLAAAPWIEDDLLIVPTSGAKAYLVAFEIESGKERWRAFEDRGNYSSPVVLEHLGRRVLVCWSGDRILGVLPRTGELFWEFPFKAARMPLGVADPVVHGKLIYFTGFYDGSLLLRLDEEKPVVHEVWREKGQNERSTRALHSIISTPFIREGHIYGVDSYGEVRCLKLMSGERVWEDLSLVPKARWATIHFVQNGKRTWMLNERGEVLVGKFSPEGYEEQGRARLLAPTSRQLNRRGGVCWSHPAFARRHIFARNDEELVCANLAGEQG